MKAWKEFINSFASVGGNLFLLTFILLCFFPLLLSSGNSESAWRACMFVLGSLTTTINTGLKIIDDEVKSGASTKTTVVTSQEVSEEKTAASTDTTSEVIDPTKTLHI